MQCGYQGKVLVGVPQPVFRPLLVCGFAGMNSGVMLFRRTPWMKSFLESVAALGRIPEPELGQVCAAEKPWTTPLQGFVRTCRRG